MFKFCPNCGQKIENYSPNFVKCSKCNKSFYNNSKPAAVVIPIYGEEILVGVRGINPQKGKLDLIGGFLESGEHPLDGAIRELEEETGLKTDKNLLKFLGFWMNKYEFEGKIYDLLDIVYFLVLDEKLKLIPKDDVAKLLWIPLDEDCDWAFPHIKKAVATLRRLRKK